MSDTDSKADLHIKAASTGRPRVYSIGPFATRVSFAVQQQRALNLVWALHETDKLKDAQRIAVIGSGIAGVTAAAALLRQGKTVWLFEEHSEALRLQAATHHRFVHPTINSWPEQERLEETTQFPFFDWYAASAAEVVSVFRDEWNVNYRGKVTPKFGVVIKDVDKNSPKDKVWLIDGNGDKHIVDLAIFSTGFGKEDNLGDEQQRSYWSADEIWKFQSGSKQKLVVSGTGDGGVIDTLRLVHDQFEHGELVFKFHRAINTEVNRARVRKIESDAREMRNNHASTEEISLFYREAYHEAFLDLTDDQKSILDNSVTYRNTVILFGKLPQPFQFNAAPVHKLMLMHALFEPKSGKPSAVRYEQASVTRPKKKFLYQKDGCASKPVGENLIIVRHGATPPIKAIINDDVLYEKFRVRQEGLNDFYSIGEVASHAIYNQEPHEKVGTSAYAASRHHLSHQYLRSQFGISAELIFEENGERPFFVAKTLNIDRPKKDLSLLPKTLFGIPLLHPSEQQPSDPGKGPVLPLTKNR